jgi:hypothetical protein
MGVGKNRYDNENYLAIESAWQIHNFQTLIYPILQPSIIFPVSLLYHPYT